GIFAPEGTLPGVSIPTWQSNTALGDSSGLLSNEWRNAPDVALAANGIFAVTTRCDVTLDAGVTCPTANLASGQRSLSGTSAASPLMAGFAALMNEYATNVGAQPVGFLNPALYQLGSNPTT